MNGGVFGEGVGRILLANVQCTGSERKLSDCMASSNGVSNCTHIQDAGVRCLPGKPNNAPPTYMLKSNVKCLNTCQL